MLRCSIFAVTFVDVRTTEQILGLICAAEPE